MDNGCMEKMLFYDDGCDYEYNDECTQKRFKKLVLLSGGTRIR